MLSYSNTDCLNNPITDLAPVSFKGKISDNNCATFNGTGDYINLGPDNVLGNVTKISFLFNGTYSSFNTFFQNIFPNIHNELRFQSNANTLRFFNDASYYDYTVSITDGNFHKIELSLSNNVPTLVIDGVTITGSQGSAPVLTGVCSIIGARYTTTSGVQYRLKGSLCDFKLYDSNDSLIHWYPLAEGANNIAYDAIGNVNGRIYSTGITTFWNTKQNVFAYNAINGFKQDSLLDTSIVSAKSPQDQQIVVYKSDFLTGNDNWYGWGVQTTLTRSDNILHAERIYASGTKAITIRNNGLGLNINQLGRNFHVKAKIVNRYSLPIQTIEVTIGTTYGTPGYGLASLKLGSEANPLNIGQDKEYIINGDTEIQNGNGFDNLFRIGVYYKNNITEAFSIDISDIELTQINNTTTYPAISNGIPPCESNIDFSQGVSNVAELNVIDPVIKIKAPDLIHNNFGADVGDGWTVGTLTETVSSGDWRANYNTSYGVNYIKNTTLTQDDINSGINYAVDISTKSNVGSTFPGDRQFELTTYNKNSYKGKNAWINFKCKIKAYSSLSADTDKLFSFGFAAVPIPLYLPNGTSLSASSTEIRSHWTKFINYAGYNNWVEVHYSGPYKFASNATVLGFGSGTSNITEQAACAIADINLQILPLGTYNKISDNGSISNLLLYKTPQTGTNLTRIQTGILHR